MTRLHEVLEGPPVVNTVRTDLMDSFTFITFLSTFLGSPHMTAHYVTLLVRISPRVHVSCSPQIVLHVDTEVSIIPTYMPYISYSQYL